MGSFANGQGENGAQAVPRGQGNTLVGIDDFRAEMDAGTAGKWLRREMVRFAHKITSTYRISENKIKCNI